tara:strand:+ start:1586 stop:2485 length:900 start_codon:yes stop_codon:yes gene_type:complete
MLKKVHKIIYFNNAFLEREKCKIHSMSPSSQFGINVFEGIRGYYNKSRYIFRLDEHLNRLSKSLDEIKIKFNLDYSLIRDIIEKLLNINDCKTNFSIRIIIYLENDGTWSDVTEGQMFIAGINNKVSSFNSSIVNSSSISLINRISNNQMPAYIKSGANYLNSRYAFLDVQRRGFEEAVLLNNRGNIAEGTGSNIFFVSNNKLITPSTDQSILNGITRNSLIQIAKKNNISVEERPVNKNEIKYFDEAFFCGTAAEIKLIKKIDDIYYKNKEVTKFLYNEYKLAVKNEKYKSFNWCKKI